MKKLRPLLLAMLLSSLATFSQNKNYQIEAYLNEVNRRVDFIIKK